MSSDTFTVLIHAACPEDCAACVWWQAPHSEHEPRGVCRYDDDLTWATDTCPRVRP